MQTVLNIIITLLVFGVLIFAHEAGHFFVAKACGVRIHEFSIGMGPALFKKQGKETLYSLRLIPVGGYVRMDGEDGDGIDERSFNRKKYWQRFLILVTGALMNIVLGFILICVINSQRALLPTTTIASFDDDAVSNSALMPGDTIVRINNYRVDNYLDLSYALTDAKTEPSKVTVIRDGNSVILDNVSFPVVEDENVGKTFTMDFYVYGEKRSFISTVRYSFDWTISITKSIYRFFFTLFAGKADINQVSGPVGTTAVIGQSVKLGISSLLLVVALITINLGIVNLLPFPALDGGRILFLIIEAIRRKPMNQKVEYAFNAVGLILLLGLVLIISIKDIIKLF